MSNIISAIHHLCSTDAPLIACHPKIQNKTLQFQQQRPSRSQPYRDFSKVCLPQIVFGPVPYTIERHSQNASGIPKYATEIYLDYRLIFYLSTIRVFVFWHAGFLG